MSALARIIQIMDEVGVKLYPEQSRFQGKSFLATYQATKNTAETIDIVLTVPNTDLDFDAKLEVSADKDASLTFNEGPTVTAATGTAITPTNHNRNSTNAATITVLRDPTITVAGTAVQTELLGNNNPKTFTYLLKKNTKYLLRVTATGDTTLININATLIESVK